MDNTKGNEKLAQSASAIGATILGFGLGANWGMDLNQYSIWIIVAGAVIHVYGMYVSQMKDPESKKGPARIVLITAWICLLALLVMVIMSLFNADT